MTLVACFAAGHRKIYKTDLETMDVHFRRLLRSVVGDPSQTNYVNPWHEFFFHDWNARVARYVQEAGVLTPHPGCGIPPRKRFDVGKV